MELFSEKSEVHTNTLKETVEGYETIRTGCGGERFLERYEQAAGTVQRGYSEYYFVGTMSFQTLMSVAGLSSIVCMGLGGWLVVKGVLTAGMLFAAVRYFTSLSNQFTNVIEYVIHIRASKKVIVKLDGQRRVECTQESGAGNPLLSSCCSNIMMNIPAASLDPTTRDSLNELIFSLQGYARIVITHDRREDYIACFDGVVML